MFSLRRLRATAALWWRLLRMQRVTREGWFYVGTTLVVGAAAINTGNNLLYLVLGLQIALLLLSAVLSEWTLQRVEVERQIPAHGRAGRELELKLVVRNRKRRFSSYSLLVHEISLPDARSWVARVPAGGRVELHSRVTVPRRGELRLEGLRITTRFPFGFFEKSREQLLPALVPIHPAGEAKLLPPPLPVRAGGERPEPFPGNGTEFHALRDFRPGDDLRHVHWPSTARAGKPLVIEKERERRRRITLLADTRGLREEEVDGLAEAAVALGRRLLLEGCEVGLSWPGGALAPGVGKGWLFHLGDAAARLRAAPRDAPAPRAHQGADPVEVPRLALAAEGEAQARPTLRRGEAQDGKLSLAVAQRGVLQAAVVSAFAALAISGELPLWAGAAFLGALIAGWALREEVPAWMRKGSGPLLLLVLFVSAFAVWQGADVMILAPAFATTLAASRLLVRRGPLDDPLLLLAALLMLAGGAGLTGDLAFGLFFCLFAVLGTLALATTQLRRELEAVGGKAAAAARGSVSGSLLGALGALSVVALLGAVFLFLLFPRVSPRVFLPGPQAQAGDAGDRIELGGIGVLKDDPTPLARVRFPQGPPTGEIYWRTRTFTHWDGTAWKRDEVPRRPVPGGGGYHPIRRVRRPVVEAEIELLRHTDALLVPGQPLDLRFPRRRGAPQQILWMGADGILSLEGGPANLRYEVRATERQVVERDPGSAVAAYLALPRLDPRFDGLARRFAGTESEPAALAERISDWLQREYRYTRDLGGEVPDPLAHFLFERREGHCEFFATALALLLRANGIPSRVVAGYYGATWVPAGEYWVVREGDAHAWTEAWIQGKGWIRLDPTPAEERPGTAEGLWASVVEALDVLRMHWSNWVLDYDGRRQMRLAREVSRSFGGGKGAGAGAGVATALKAGGSLTAALVLAWLLYRFLPLLGGKGRRAPRARTEATRLFQLVKKRLRRRGIHLPPSAPSERWADAARAQLGDEARPFEEAIVRYEEARFGGRALEPGQVRALRRQLPR